MCNVGKSGASQSEEEDERKLDRYKNNSILVKQIKYRASTILSIRKPLEEYVPMYEFGPLPNSPIDIITFLVVCLLPRWD